MAPNHADKPLTSFPMGWGERSWATFSQNPDEPSSHRFPCHDRFDKTGRCAGYGFWFPDPFPFPWPSMGSLACAKSHRRWILSVRWRARDSFRNQHLLVLGCESRRQNRFCTQNRRCGKGYIRDLCALSRAFSHPPKFASRDHDQRFPKLCTLLRGTFCTCPSRQKWAWNREPRRKTDGWIGPFYPDNLPVPPLYHTVPLIREPDAPQCHPPA